MIQKEYNELVLQEISIEAENYDGEIIKVNESIFFITEEAKETVLDFSLGNSQLNKWKSGIKKWYWSNFENLIKCCWWF